MLKVLTVTLYAKDERMSHPQVSMAAQSFFEVFTSSLLTFKWLMVIEAPFMDVLSKGGARDKILNTALIPLTREKYEASYLYWSRAQSTAPCSPF